MSAGVNSPSGTLTHPRCPDDDDDDDDLVIVEALDVKDVNGVDVLVLVNVGLAFFLFFGLTLVKSLVFLAVAGFTFSILPGPFLQRNSVPD